MAEQDEQKQGAAAGGASEFETMFEETCVPSSPAGSLKAGSSGLCRLMY